MRSDLLGGKFSALINSGAWKHVNGELFSV